MSYWTKNENSINGRKSIGTSLPSVHSFQGEGRCIAAAPPFREFPLPPTEPASMREDGVSTEVGMS